VGIATGKRAWRAGWPRRTLHDRARAIGWKTKYNAGAGAGLLFERSIQLVGEDPDDPQAERLRVAIGEAAGGQTNAIVFDGQL
jgi:hypothetical protein